MIKSCNEWISAYVLVATTATMALALATFALTVALSGKSDSISGILQSREYVICNPK